MDKKHRQQPARGSAPAPHSDTSTSPGADRLPNDAVDLINRALFEEWLHRYGSWDAFLDAAERKRKEEGEGPTTH
jgi:hypothetical protein